MKRQLIKALLALALTATGTAKSYADTMNTANRNQVDQLSETSTIRAWRCIVQGVYDFAPFTTSGVGRTRTIAMRLAISRCEARGYLSHGCRVKECHPILWL